MSLIGRAFKISKLDFLFDLAGVDAGPASGYPPDNQDRGRLRHQQSHISDMMRAESKRKINIYLA